MRGFLKRIRGVIGTGLTWAVGWAALWGLVLLTMAGLGRLEGFDLWATLRAELLVGGAGFIAGAAFGAVLSVLERHKRLEDLSAWRIALWGGLGGLVFLAVLGPQYLVEVIVVWLLGVGSATGSLALARTGGEPKLSEGVDPPLLGSDDK